MVGCNATAGPDAWSGSVGEEGDRLALPSFSALDQEGRERGSDDLIGRPHVLWFHSMAGTPGCTKEGCGYRDLWSEFRELGVGVVGVTYAPLAENRDWSEKQGFPFQLWSEPDGSLAHHFGAASWYSLAPSRVTVLLDERGRVLRRYDDVHEGTSPERVLSDCRALFGSRSGGGAQGGGGPALR